MSHSRTLLRKTKADQSRRQDRGRGLPKGTKNKHLIDVSHYAATGFLAGVSPNDWRTFEAFGREASYHATKGLRINVDPNQ